MDDEEFKIFPGVVILIGVYKSNNKSVKQLWSRLDGWPIFNRTISRERYQQILRFLQFDNAQSIQHHRSPDKKQPIREVFETWDFYLRDSYTCRPSMIVHEQLVCVRRRCPFKQYIRSKPGKYGIKLWTICDSTRSYTWKMQVYIRKDAVLARETKQGTRVVIDLAEDIDNFCRNITCGNFFTNPSLARKLLQKKLALIGTMRKSKPKLPAEFTVAKERNVKSTVFGFQLEAMIYRTVLKQTVLSIAFNDAESAKNRKHFGSETKHYSVLQQKKGGVDTLDRTVRSYSTKRTTQK